MSGIFFDTDIVIDALQGQASALAELRRARRPWISRLSWMEIMANAPEAVLTETGSFLSHFAVAEVDEEIARRASTLRRQRPAMRPIDAVVLASAQSGGRILVTRNAAAFPANMPGIRIPYTLEKKN